FPTLNAIQNSLRNQYGNAFVSKLSPDGSSLIYSTFLGGSGGDEGNGIAVDANGNAYIVGTTKSADFPTRNAFQATLRGGANCFVTKLAVDGSLLYSTFLGGSSSVGDYASGIAIDSSGNAYITGEVHSTDFPILNPLPNSTNTGGVFVSKLS